MNNPQIRRTQSFRRVPDWCTTHPDILQAAPATVATHLADLATVVTNIETMAVTQDAQHGLSTRSSTDATQRRAGVRDAMRPISQVAKGLTGTVMGISAISKMPKSHVDNDALVTAANSMVENATSFKDVLIAHGARPDFIETLQTAATALKSSVDARGQAKATAVGATKGIHTELLAGNKLVSFIDVALMPQLKGNSAALASWRNAKRVTTKGAIPVLPPATTPATVATPSTKPVVGTVAPAVGATPVVAAAPAVTVVPVVTAAPAVAAIPTAAAPHTA